MNIKETLNFLQNKQNINFILWLNKDKRRLLLVKKVISALFKNQDNRLTFEQLLKETKLCRSSLSSIIKKLRLMKILSDYDAEKIIHKKFTTDGLEYTANNDEERFYYRYKYKFNDSNETALLITAIATLNIIHNKNA